MDADLPINGVYVHGVICTDPVIDENYHNANYYISDDGTAGESNQLYVYHGRGMNGEDMLTDEILND